MGYRSSVAITMTKELFSKFITLCKSEEGRQADLYELIVNADEMHFKDDEYLILFFDIKWYSEFPDVSLIESFMSKDGYNHCSFVRTGEEYDDNETMGYSEVFECGISREITYSI